VTVRALARRLLGVTRTKTYYLPWIAREGVDCALLLNNVEMRFKPGHNRGPFVADVVQYDAAGTVVLRQTVSLAGPHETVEVPLRPAPPGYGFATVSGALQSDLYVTLSDGEVYTATHGRGEWIEVYPPLTRALLATVGAVLARSGRTVGSFTRDQYVYTGADSRSHVLVLNLANVTNRIRARLEGAREQLVAVPPMGAHLFDADDWPGRDETVARRLRLEGNAWFNLYLVGAGRRGVAGPPSLMHVK
jgi:hypothetical protein